MSLFVVLTVIQALVAAALVGVVLMQRSEGGGLGIGGNPGGALGARGAADFLTRSTKWLAVAFVVLSITLAALAVRGSSIGEVTTTMDREVSTPTSADLLGETGEGSAAEGSAGEGDATGGDDPLGGSADGEAPADDPLG